MKANQTIAAVAFTGFIIAKFLLYTGPESGLGLDASAKPAKRFAHEAVRVRPGGPLEPAAPSARGPAAREPASAQGQGAVHHGRLSVLETLLTRDRPVGSDGTIDRTEIVRTSLKYPLVRIAQRISAAGTLLSRQEMVADHVLVQLQNGATQVELEQVLSQQPFSAYVRRAARTPGLFLVAFDGSDPATLGKVIQTLQEQAQVIKYSEPDLIVHAF